MNVFDPAFVHPDTLRKEPVRRWGFLGTLRILVGQLVAFVLVTALTWPFWPLYSLLRIFWRRPPNVPSFSRHMLCFRAILADWSPHGPTLAMRMSLLLEFLRHCAANGWAGFAWYLDEIIWGRELAKERIIEPIFEVSAARSGSTQLARYLEDDPQICAPNAMQIAAPFYWLWRIAPYFARFITKERAETMLKEKLPAEHHERHETDPFRTDTFEVLFVAVHQLGDIFMSISKRTQWESFRVDEVTDGSRELWEDDFLRFIDAIGRKTLLHAKFKSGGERKRLLIKGHFLLVAEHLAQKYPDARFLTMIRAPEKRIQSLINFLRCQGTIAPCPPIPWTWLVEYACTTEISYCEKEMSWYQSPNGPRRCVIPFDDYIRDLEGTMRKVYRDCWDQDLPPHIPREHAPRVRTNYSVDRSLAELGVDEKALKTRLQEYGAWCRSGTRP